MKKNLRFVSLLLIVLMVYSSTLAFIPARTVFADEADVDMVEPVSETTEEDEIAETEEVILEDTLSPEEIIEEEDIFEFPDEVVIVDPADVEDYVPEDVTDADVVDPEEEPSAKQPEEIIEKTLVEQFVERVYFVTLNRVPTGTTGGHVYWRDELTAGKQTGISLVYSFFNSNEYIARNRTNAQYVQDLYKAFMGREVDVNVGGAKYWVDQLNAGVSRKSVFSGFANSVEFFNICKSYGICAGTYVEGRLMSTVAQVNLFVNRFYVLILGRNGDKGGIEYWTNQLINRKMDGAKVAYQFLFGPEYRKLNKSNAAFVSDLYQALMGRTVNVTDTNYWMKWLNEKAYDIDVFNGFVTSTEFTNICNGYGITRGNAFDKFSMDWENCFARDLSNYDAPLTYLVAPDCNSRDRVRWSLFGFENKYIIKIFYNNTLIVSGDTCDCFYDESIDMYASYYENYINNAGELIPNGTYRVVAVSQLGYTIAQATVTAFQNYNALDIGDYLFFYPYSFTEYFLEEIIYFDGNQRYDGHFSRSNDFELELVTSNEYQDMYADWYYSPNGSWDNRSFIGVSYSSGSHESYISNYDDGRYYYHLGLDTEELTNGTYWCVIRDEEDNLIAIARCYCG